MPPPWAAPPEFFPFDGERGGGSFPRMELKPEGVFMDEAAFGPVGFCLPDHLPLLQGPLLGDLRDGFFRREAPPMAPWGTFPPPPPAPGDATVGRGSARKAKRMIKNRESAARSRARKQAYTTQLEDEIKRLKERNLELTENLLLLKIPDEDLAPPPPPEKKPQRSSSVGF